MNLLNLTTIKKIVSLLLCLTLFACSSTEQGDHKALSDNGYDQISMNNFSHGNSSYSDKDTIKKPLNSDHQLMMSLLNRPMTADQAMMLTFAQERARYTNTFANNADNGIAIKGDKKSDPSSSRAKHVYAQLISQDINAVSITASQ